MTTPCLFDETHLNFNDVLALTNLGSDLYYVVDSLDPWAQLTGTPPGRKWAELKAKFRAGHKSSRGTHR